MPPSFGTSGLRGLVTELTDELITDMVRAYLATCAHVGAVMVGWNLRDSSPAIARIVLAAIAAAGVQPIRAGAVPTPALALAATADGCGAIMVTGSHIPADRNGLKFYTVTGEISKQDEQSILAASGQDWPAARAQPETVEAPDTTAAYVARYVAGYGPQALAGQRIGVYQHSSVARDLMMEVFAGLGAVPAALARADHFIPVDTEAVAPETRDQLAQWCHAHQLDALASTDGDADRPLSCDARGQVIAGDVLGVLTARALGTKLACTLVSSNSMVGLIADFETGHRTRIGSPYAIAAMEGALAADPLARVVGYGANGGFLRLAPAPWAQLEDISIDHAVMEKADNLSVVPFSAGWSDLGGWDAVWREGARDAQGVQLSGAATAIDCEDTLLRADSDDLELVGIGLKDMVVVAMNDAVLVADRSRTQDVKLAVAALKKKGEKQATDLPKDHRPWGWFESLAVGPRFQVKRIHVHPGAALSLQSHFHQSEHWIVVEGTAKVTVDDETRLVTENESIYIPLGAVHRMENPGKVPMVLIEVQTGSYVGEDDIVRHADKYARMAKD